MYICFLCIIAICTSSVMYFTVINIEKCSGFITDDVHMYFFFRKITWEECSQRLQTRSSHLMSLTNDTIQSFAQASDPTFSTYAEKYDLSKGDLQVV